MKLRIFLLFILLSIAASISAVENNADQQSEITAKYESLDKRIKSLENINSKFGTEYLISHYSTSFDHMFTIQTMVIGFLGLLSIIIPLFTYLFAFRPMKKAENKFNKFESRVEDLVKSNFETYIKENKYSMMNEALHNLSSSDSVLKQSAISYVIVNQDFIIDEYLASLIYNILEPNNTEPTLRLALQTLISSNDNIWANKYFKKLYDIPEDCYPHLDYVLKYLSRYYSKEISDFVISFSKKRFEISKSNYIADLFSDPYNLPSILPDYSNDFLDNKEYIDLLGSTKLSQFKNIIISYSRQHPFQHEKTYLFKKQND